MDQLLLDFVNTFDIALKKVQEKVGKNEGLSRLTVNQLQYIDAIHLLGQPTITEIAAELRITKASVTAGVNKLVNLGYATKDRSTEDKRVYHVSITETGKQLILAKYQALKEYGNFLDAALEKDEAIQFRATLSKIVVLFKHQTKEKAD
jgi:DNA-binding MarR family transcriptional regulator